MVATTQVNIRSKLLRLEQELSQIFLEREELIRVIILSLLTRQHTLVFGKHGAAKSSLIRAVASALTCGCFSIQLGKDTTESQVFGPTKVSQLAHDRLCRAYENFLPGKPIAFLDEIDKANSIILNSLYTAMEERLFLDDGILRPMPLISLFGAANRIEMLQTDQLAPLLDRFLFRVEVDWLQSDSNFLEFMRRKAEHDTPILTTSLSLQELASLHLEIQQVSFPRSTLESIGRFKNELASENIFASDRRWGNIISLLQANAFLSGDQAVWEEHFYVLKAVLWTNQKQIPVIERLLKALDKGLSPQLKTLLEAINIKVDALLQEQDATALLADSALVINDLNYLRQEINQSIASSPSKSVRQVLSQIDRSIQQVTAHRKTICNI
jgi:MoxR-like ATPase